MIMKHYLIKIIQQLTGHLARNTIILGLGSLFWLLYRSGTKPSRIVYPCQKAAATNVYACLIYPVIAFFAAIPGKFAPEVSQAVKHSSRKRTIILVTLIALSAASSGLAIYANILANPLSVLRERTTPNGTLASVSVVHVDNNLLQDSLGTAINLLSRNMS